MPIEPKCHVVTITPVKFALEPLLLQFQEQATNWLKNWLDVALETQLLMTVLNKDPNAENDLADLRLNTFGFNVQAEETFFHTVRSALTLDRGECFTKVSGELYYIFILER